MNRKQNAIYIIGCCDQNQDRFFKIEILPHSKQNEPQLFVMSRTFKTKLVATNLKEFQKQFPHIKAFIEYALQRYSLADINIEPETDNIDLDEPNPYWRKVKCAFNTVNAFKRLTKKPKNVKSQTSTMK